MLDEAPPSSAAPLVRSPIIGRDGELALLKQAYDSVLARAETRIVTLVGPAGVGKTRLLEQLLAELPPARKPRVVRGSARAQGLGYGVFDSALALPLRDRRRGRSRSDGDPRSRRGRRGARRSPRGRRVLLSRKPDGDLLQRKPVHARHRRRAGAGAAHSPRGRAELFRSGLASRTDGARVRRPAIGRRRLGRSAAPPRRAASGFDPAHLHRASGVSRAPREAGWPSSASRHDLVELAPRFGRPCGTKSCRRCSLPARAARPIA